MRVRVAWGDSSEQVLLKLAGFSALAHLAALIVFSVIPRFMEPAAPLTTTIAEIVPASALLPPPGAAAPPAREEGPTPSQRAEEAMEALKKKPAETKPAPKPKPDRSIPPLEKPIKKEPPKPAEPPAPRQETPSPAEEPPAGGPEGGTGPHGISLGGASTAGGIPSIGSSAFPYDYYRGSLVALLQSNWRRPVAPEGLGTTLTCRVQFTILKSGIIQDPHLAVSSGNEALDRSALRAVYDSNPLPPLPFQYAQASVSAEVVFELTPD
jgi:periplasmic protein TonB